MPQLLVLFLVKHITADDSPQTDYQYSIVGGGRREGGPVLPIVGPMKAIVFSTNS